MAINRNTESAFALIQIKDKMKTGRSTFENVWQQISEFVLPNRGDFQCERSQGDRADKRVFDTTAVQANEMLAAALHGGLINPASNWFALSTSDLKNSTHAAKQWLDEAQRIMMKSFNSQKGNFYQQAHELFLDLVAYGTSVMYVDEEGSDGIRFSTRHLSEIHITEDHKGVVDTVVRTFKFTARQAAQKWGEENLSDGVRSALAADPHREFDFFHVVMPRVDAKRIAPNEVNEVSTKKEYISFYVCEEDKHIVDVQGFYENPYIVVRWEKLVGEAYGRSPAWNSLSDIRMINVMSEVLIRSAQKQVDPPLLVADDGVIMPLHTRPSGINVGGVSLDGRPLIQPLQTGGNLQVGLEMMQQRREAIRQAYFVDQFIPKEGTPVTATEAIQNQENRLRLTGPQLARIQAEFLAFVVDRVFSIHQRAKSFPEAPEELQGVDLNVEYTSPLAKTQRAQELVSLNRALESSMVLLETNPDLLEVVDGESYLRDALDISGVSAKHIRSEEDYADIVQQRQEQMKQEQQLAVAGQAAESAAKLKKAGVDIG